MKLIICVALGWCLAFALALAAPSAELKPEIKKPGFKDKHPKVYRVFRKTRTACIAVGPIVNVGANVVTACCTAFRRY